MARVDVAKIRNVAVVGHSGAGKTALVEAMLFGAGAISRIGRAADGNTAMDYTEEEHKRQMSIFSGVAVFPYKDCQVGLIDTPGFADFSGELTCALAVADCGMLVLGAADGLQVGAIQAWKQMDARELPRMIVVNQLDRENTSFQRLLETLQERYGKNVAPVHVPIGQSDSFSGVVDLLSGVAYTFGGEGKSPQDGDVPADMADECASLREALTEAAAEADDALIEKYLEQGELTPEELLQGVRAGFASGTLVPVLCASATGNIGPTAILDFIAGYAPSPADRPARTGDADKTREARPDAPFSAFVFKLTSEQHVGETSFFRVVSGTISNGADVLNSSKGESERFGSLMLPVGKNRTDVDEAGPGDIIAVTKLKNTSVGDTLCDAKDPVVFPAPEYPEPVMAIALEPETKKDQEKLGTALTQLTSQSPTLRIVHDSVARQTVLQGLGEVQIEVAIEQLKSRYGVSVGRGEPRIHYKETIRGTVKVQGRHKKQTGGRGQFGDCWLELSPLPRGTCELIEFESTIFGGSIPSKFVPAVEKGVRQSATSGPLAGYPVVDVKVNCYDGSYHAVDSSDLAFQIAGSLAFKKGFMECRPTLLEPIMEVEVLVPDDCVGDITGDLNSRRGRVMGMEPSADMQTIRAEVPQGEMMRYSTDLKSMTGGRGFFTARTSRYEEMPDREVQQVVAQSGKKTEEE